MFIFPSRLFQVDFACKPSSESSFRNSSKENSLSVDSVGSDVSSVVVTTADPRLEGALHVTQGRALFSVFCEACVDRTKSFSASKEPKVSQWTTM